MLGYLWVGAQPGRSIRPIATSAVIWCCHGASQDSNLGEAGRLRLSHGSFSAIELPLLYEGIPQGLLWNGLWVSGWQGAK